MNARDVPRPAATHNIEHSNAVGLMFLAALLATWFPGSLLGAAVAWAMWQLTRPDLVTKWLFAGLGSAMVALLRTSIAAGWGWRLALQGIDPSHSADLSLHAVVHSATLETLLGPLLVATVQSSLVHWHRTIHGQEWTRYREMAAKKKALERGWPGPASTRQSAGAAHPADTIRLGVDAKDSTPFDLTADDVAQHVFIPGASGTGKTTTIARLADGALANGYGVVIVDCKGSGLGGAAKALAERRHVPFTLVDPRDDATAGYDPCSGDAAAVANKLIGAFSFSGEAEIYKQVAMEVIPIICRALQASGTPASLDAIYEALNSGGLAQLGRRTGVPETHRKRLEDLDRPSGVGAAGYIGMQKRLGALMEGTFGDIFRKRPALDWHEQLATPQVTYLSLSATAAGEDVELFGRVITQDLKQMCDERMRALDRREAVTPTLLIYDEFAALREATQIVDLLLQARQAKAPLVVATQFLPEEASIRRPLLAAGVLIVHRLEAEDAERIAAQLGTHTTPMLTAQVDYESGESQKGSVRWVEEFNFHPNELKELPVGMAAVLARRGVRRSLVRIHNMT